MNIKSLLFAILLMAGFVYGQGSPYPLVTLSDINFMPDSTTGWPVSPLEGDTVRVQGTVLVRPVVDPITNRTTVLYFGSAWGCYIQSEDSSPWGGLNIYQADTSVTGQATFFDLSDTAITYEFTGKVTTYGQATELVLITSPTPIPVQQINTHPERPAPIRLTLDSCFNTDGSFNVKLRKYLGMYVEVVADAEHPIITSNLITGTGSTAGGFKIDNGNGRMVQVYAQSRYFKTGSSYTLRPDYVPPRNGSYLGYMRGILEAYNNVWEITPMYPEDLGPMLQSPPTIANCRRNMSIVPQNTPVTVTATITGNMGAYVTGAKLFTRVNGVSDSVVMTRGTGADSINYTAVIPGIGSDSAFVDYYVKADDNNDLFSTSPQTISTSRYSYFVLGPSHTFGIVHVRYSPLGSGYSGYNGYPVTVTGIVTADTSSIPGSGANNPPRVFIQDGSGPWSGIILGYKGDVGMNVYNLKKGDKVTVSGTPVMSTTTGTRLDTLTALTVVSSGNALPEPHVMATASVGQNFVGNLSSEPWNSCLVTYQNVTIDSANADGNYNYGESFCTDTAGGRHTRITWSDGRTRFFAGPTAVKVSKGDRFESITGILGYTHSNYKLCPRNDDDLVGYIPVAVNDARNVLPSEYQLYQNYPNPFNPSTMIKYDLTKSGLVTLKIYNVLGQEVRTLVNQFEGAGSHQVSFNASSFNSGVYFYSLSVNDFTIVKKMVLIK